MSLSRGIRRSVSPPSPAPARTVRERLLEALGEWSTASPDLLDVQQQEDERAWQRERRQNAWLRTQHPFPDC